MRAWTSAWTQTRKTDAQIKQDMDAALEFARKSPEPEVEFALQDIFTE